MPKTVIAIGLAGLLLAAASASAPAAPISALPTSTIEGLGSNVIEAGWRRCWRDRWGRLRCHWCWRDRWGRVRCR